ncbi:MAG: sigma-70 family RNA polymerase sigma factor [Clostridia bacterium]|nr:sigma-70 family RNA polymerase sigma factor [Clostridia bacterium]
MLAFYLSLLETQEDKDKFEYLYEKYRPLLRHVAYRILHDPQLAEDAVHNAFLNMMKSLCDLEDLDCHKTKRFVVVVTENAAIDMLRKSGRIPLTDYEQAESSLSVTPDLLGRLSAEELADLLEAMPEIYRTPLELRVYHRMNDKQIADALNISHAAARKRLERARAMLSAALRDLQGEK